MTGILQNHQVTVERLWMKM